MQMAPNLFQFTPEHKWHGGFLSTENVSTESSYIVNSINASFVYSIM